MTRALLVLLLALPLAGCLELTTAPKKTELKVQEPAPRDSAIVCTIVAVQGVITICCRTRTVNDPACGVPQ